MKNEQNNFRVLLRGPKFPVIVIDDCDMLPAFNIKQLCAACYLSAPSDYSKKISVVDCTGEEFLYLSDETALMPTISRKKWTKKEFIDLYNSIETAKEENLQYSPKSLSNKRLADIVHEICKLLGHNNRVWGTARAVPPVPQALCTLSKGRLFNGKNRN